MRGGDSKLTAFGFGQIGLDVYRRRLFLFVYIFGGIIFSLTFQDKAFSVSSKVFVFFLKVVLKEMIAEKYAARWLQANDTLSCLSTDRAMCR